MCTVHILSLLSHKTVEIKFLLEYLLKLRLYRIDQILLGFDFAFWCVAVLCRVVLFLYKN